MHASDADYAALWRAPAFTLGVRLDGDSLSGLDFLPVATPDLPVSPAAQAVLQQLDAYLADPAFVFELPCCLRGTAFQQRVWQALRTIPSGEVLTYGQLARQLGSAPRAVGQACGANPLPLIYPCHRVVSAKGLGGFMQSAGADTLSIKRWLLQHERG